ncbi:MAG TPA: HD domain-containing phosphohydrolase [Methylophilus sp.]
MIDFLKKAPLVEQVVPSTEESLVWCVLIVDDDPEVHAVTRLALRDFQFENREVQIISAYSGEEARSLFAQRDDISLALVDVVMESEHAGLELVKHLRVDQGNHKVRLVLRTGQAGQAPEDRVIREYDIDDYREKTDLTKQKLRTLMYSMLRAYRDLAVIEAQRDGLQTVIESCAKVQDSGSFSHFALAALEQMILLHHFEESEIYCIDVPGKNRNHQSARILTTTNQTHTFEKEGKFESLPAIVAQRFEEVLALKISQHYPDAYVFYCATQAGGSELVYISHRTALNDLDRQLLEIYVQNLAVTFGNINLQDDLQESSKELVFTLTHIVEARSNETGAHILRVALVSQRLAQLCGLTEYESTLVRIASPLHDIGKIAIPDTILHKPEKLDPAEWDMMKKHVDYGVALLQRSKSELMQIATQIAGTHHERWDGNGYPKQLKGEDIPIVGRITALADVFDALSSKRCYKPAWTANDVLDFIVAERGKQFDPLLVDLFVTHYDEFVDICSRHPDTFPSH